MQVETDFAEAPFASASPRKDSSVVVESEGKPFKHPTFLMIIGYGPYVLHSVDVIDVICCLQMFLP